MSELAKKEKILIFRYRFLGDTILTVPFLKRLREANPNAHIAVLIAPQSGQLLFNCPYIDELIEVDTTRFHKYDSGKGNTKSFWQLAWELRKCKFDRAYILKRSFSSAFLAWLAGITHRIGFNTEGRGFLLTQKIVFDLKKAEVLNFLAHLPKPFNEAPARKDIYFWPTEAEKQKAKILINSLNSATRKKIAIHAPAAHPLKMWTIEQWAELIKLLKRENYQIIFSGAPADATYYEQIENLAETKADLNLCTTQNTLRENVAVYAQCDLAICVDSGPMHLAAAVGIPVLSIFGPSDPTRWHPWNEKYKVASASLELACRPCNMKPTCTQRECLTELQAKDVFEAALSLLNE